MTCLSLGKFDLPRWNKVDKPDNIGRTLKEWWDIEGMIQLKLSRAWKRYLCWNIFRHFQSAVTRQVEWLTQGNKSVTNYIAKFNEYLNQCDAIEFESPEQTLSRFRSGLKKDYCKELIAREITTLEQAYQLVTNLDDSRGSYFHRSDFRDSSKTTTASKPSYNQSFSVPSKPISCFSSIKRAGSSSAKPITFEKENG